MEIYPVVECVLFISMNMSRAYMNMYNICAFPDFLLHFYFFSNIVNVAYVDNFNLIT